MISLDFRNTNALWCSVMAETLARCGVTCAVVSPGSRSTPLTLTLARHGRIEAIPVLDERSAAFFALGQAKQTGRPAVLVCTSGTAGANYLPAVIEAHESGTPLIVITADRPPEMRDCASGQTIDQQKLFGGFVCFYHEFAVPEARMTPLRYLRQTTVHAVAAAMAGGPVHLNAPFRDPLTPVEDGTAAPLKGEDWGRFFDVVREPERTGCSGTILGAAESGLRGVIVAGNDWPHSGICGMAAALGWPVLADALSPARLRSDAPGVAVAAYDAILRDTRTAARLRPEIVLMLGEIPTSKILRAWLETADVPMIQVVRREPNRDSLHGRTRSVRLAPEDVKTLEGHAFTPCAPDWLAAWLAAESAAQRVLAAGVAAEDGFEGGCTRAVAETLGADRVLFVSSSMPVRDLEYFAPARSDGPRVLANRGANGIDGTLSTALGVAHAGASAVLLTGDLSLLHDTNGFLSAMKLRGSLTIVLINNGGGGIFGHLPVAKDNPFFEDYWATPQTVDFGKLCAAYGVPHEIAAGAGALRERLQDPAGRPGVRVIEVHTDRTRDVATRQRLFAEAARATGDVLA